MIKTTDSAYKLEILICPQLVNLSSSVPANVIYGAHKDTRLAQLFLEFSAGVTSRWFWQSHARKYYYSGNKQDEDIEIDHIVS
jgi:hypothetical protein